MTRTVLLATKVIVKHPDGRACEIPKLPVEADVERRDTDTYSSPEQAFAPPARPRFKDKVIIPALADLSFESFSWADDVEEERWAQNDVEIPFTGGNRFSLDSTYPDLETCSPSRRSSIGDYLPNLEVIQEDEEDKWLLLGSDESGSESVSDAEPSALLSDVDSDAASDEAIDMTIDEVSDEASDEASDRGTCSYRGLPITCGGGAQTAKDNEGDDASERLQGISETREVVWWLL